MSQVIENKVVEMQFDNSNFEKNVKQSMDSLNQLNESLDNVGNDTKAFSGITDALNNLNTTVGKINPLKWNIWTDIYNAAKGVGSRLVGAIMEPIQMASAGGWQRALNIEQAKFQLEGAGQDVEVAFKSASEAVNDTAYSLDAAASIASQLAGSGMQAGDEMTAVLKSISGVAAQTMASYEEIGDIFVDVNSAGKLTGDALNRLAMRGLNARADLAKALGKSEADISKMVSKGQISFKQFADAMSKYTDHAFKANETYSGSLANLHAALNKIGADFGQYKIKDMVTLFNSLRKMVNKVRVELTPISEIYGKIHAIGVKLISDFIDKLDFKWLTPVFDGVANIFMQLIKIGAAVADTIKEIFPKDLGNRIQTAAEKFRSFTETLSVSEETLGKIQRIVKGVIAFFDIIFTIIKQLISGLFNVGSGFGSLGETILTVAACVGDALVMFSNWLHETNALTVAINYLKNALLVVGVTAVGLVLKVVEFIKAIKENEHVVKIISAIAGAFDKLKGSIGSLKTSASGAAGGAAKAGDGGIFGTISEQLKKFRDLVESIVGEITPAKVTIAAAAAVIIAVIIAILVVINKLSNSIKSYADSVASVGKIPNTIKNWIEDYRKAGDEARKAAEKKSHFIKFLAVVGLVTAFVFALKGLAAQPLEQILAATVSVLAIIAVIWRMTESVSKLPKSAEKNFKVLNSISLMIAAIGWALAKAAKQNWAQLATAGAAIAGCLLSLVPVIKAIGKLQPNDLKNIAGRSGLISTLVLAFPAIGKALAKAAQYNWKSLAAAGVSISACMLTLAGVIAILSKIDAEKLDAKKTAAMLALCIGLIPIGSAISKVAQFEWDHIFAAAGGLVAAVGVLALVVYGLSNIDENNLASAVAGAAGLLIVSLSMIPIALAIKQLATYNWSQLWPSIASMGITIAVLTGALAALGALGAASEGIGAAAILAAAAAIWICGKALLDIGKAALEASVAIEHLAQAFVVLSHGVDFGILIDGGQRVINFLKDFDEVAWTAIKAAVSLRIGGQGFAAFAAGLKSLADVNIDKTSENIVKIFNAIGEGMSKLQGWGVELEIFAHAFEVFGNVLKGVALASIAIGAGLVLAGVGMLAAGAGLKMMIDPLERMQDLDWVLLSLGLKNVGDACLQFASIALVLTLFSDGLLQTAIAMGALAIECYAFSKFDLQAIADGLGSIAVAGLSLGGAGLLMVVGAVGVTSMAVAIISLGAAISGAAILIANGVDTIVKSLDNLKKLKTIGVNAVQGFINGVNSTIPKAIASGLKLASGFYDSIIKFLGIASPSKLLRTVGQFTGSGFIIGIADKLDEAEASGKGLSLSALAGVSGFEDLFAAEGAKQGGAYAGSFMSIVDSFFNSGDISRTGANGMPSDVAAKMKKSGTSGLNGLLDQFNSKLFDTTEVEKKVEEASKGAAGGLDTLGDSAGKAGKKAKEAKDEIASFYDKIESSISLFDEFKKEDPMDPAQLIQNMKSQIEGIAGWSTQIQQLATKGIDQGLLKKLADMGPSGYKYTQAFVNMTAEQLAEANKYFEQSLMLPQHVTAQIYGSYEIAGMNAGEGFIGGLNKEDVKTEGVKFAYSFLDSLRGALGIHSPSKETEQDGKNVTEGMINGITWPTMLFNLENATTRMCMRITDTIDKKLKEDNFITIGKNVVAGIEKGIQDQGTQSSLFDKVKALCQKVINTAKSPQGFNEHSPSRVFEQIGKYVTEGLAIGITSNTDMATSAIQKLTDQTISNMEYAVSRIQNMTDTDLDLEPVIRPVIDTDNLQSGFGMINSLFNDENKTEMLVNNSRPIDYLSKSEVMAVNDNSDVVNAVTSLKEDIGSLQSAITNIKMVLDTGTMVGAMTADIDQQLGRRQVLAGRGI